MKRKLQSLTLALLLATPATFASTFSCQITDKNNGESSIATVKEYDSGFSIKIFGSGVEFETESYMNTKTLDNGAVINQSYPTIIPMEVNGQLRKVMVTMQRAYFVQAPGQPVFTIMADDRLWLYTHNCSKMENV
ncbi:hypothetical protein [Cronobacter phage vB_Cdu_VP8]|nr:hypothetical protein [Cronobacter phage vB_Cdu_VP8]